MLKRLFRFHGHGGVRAVQRQGQSVRGEFMALKFMRVRSAGRPYRASVVVSRKVSKSAPVRNRIRRRVYEIIRTHQESIPGGSDFVISVFDARIADMEHVQLERLVAGLLKKAGLLS